MFIIKQQGTYTVIKVGTGESYTLVAFSLQVPIAFIFIPNGSSAKASGTMVRISATAIDRHGRKHIEKFAREEVSLINHNQVAESFYKFDVILESAIKASQYDHSWTPGSPRALTLFHALEINPLR